ncbi:MAG TPA: NADH-quinone oxidoreductase subunit NuoK [Planctomycetota bacterium]|nr:NADH-quinone oxidoreductase subunit NuoK [Planctomycetota bacterium]
MFSLGNCILLSAALFAIGAYGVLARRNLLVVLMSIEVMLNAANIALAAFSRHFAAGGRALASAAHGAGSGDGGQVFVLMSMAVAACEVAVGLALLISLFRARETVLTVDLAELKG